MGLSNIEDILQAGLDGETLPTPESRIAELLKEWIEQGGNIDDILVAGSNITLTKNPDGTITIAASGEVSSEDTVARAEIAAIKDGETLDSFGDVETALEGKADTTDIPTIPITAIQKNGTGITPVSGTVNITVPTQASDINAATAVQGSKADTAIQGIKVNSSTVNPDSNKVVSITVPTSAADVSALPNTTKYAAALSLTINSSTFVMTGQLKDQNGDNLGTAQTIDLPLESVVVGGSYNSQTKKVVLTLQNGNTIEFSVADLVSGLQTELSASNKLNPAYINYDSTHRAVSDTEKSTWNGKQNAIDSSHQLSADLVDDTNATNKFATAAELKQISTNKNNISINSIKSSITMEQGYTLVSQSTLYQQGKHIFGNLIIKKDSGNYSDTSETVCTLGKPPAITGMLFCGFGASEWGIESIGYAFLGSTGGVSVKDTKNTNTTVNIAVDYVIS